MVISMPCYKVKQLFQLAGIGNSTKLLENSYMCPVACSAPIQSSAVVENAVPLLRLNFQL